MPFKNLGVFFKKVIALFLFLLNPRKQAIERNLEKLGIMNHRGRIAFRTYYNLFNSYLMLLEYILFKKHPSLFINNEEYMKKGKIFVSLHYGPWDLALRLVMKKYPFVSVVGKRDFLNVLREKHGIKLLYSRDGLGKIMKSARKSRIALMLDRTFYEKGVFIRVGMSYLKVSRAAIIMAQRLKQDIFFIKTIMLPDGSIELTIHKIPYGSFDSMIEKVTTIINQTLSDKPEWWFNFFTKWL